ncbi:MAG: PH domain-containing protein [Acetobacteraceae bacterium]|nr:PH domain-containing protein [Acetobacteraceae bacterium]
MSGERLPERLPAGERVLWRGRPRWQVLARRAFHIRGLAAYFGVLLGWYAVTAFTSGADAADAALATLRMAALAVTPLGLIAVYAWLCSRNASYWITNRRVVIRAGIAVPVTYNLPFSRLASAGLRTWADGSGSIALTLLPPDRVAFFALWPHTKPWRLARPEPMLRCIDNAERAAQILARALAAEAAVPVPPAPETAPAPDAARPRAPALA